MKHIIKYYDQAKPHQYIHGSSRVNSKTGMYTKISTPSKPTISGCFKSFLGRCILIPWLLPLLTLLSGAVSASDTDSLLDTLNDTVSVSFSYDDGDTHMTLDASHDINDSWRVFGEIDTLGYWEAGIGYNFIVGEVYNEVSVKGLGGDNYISDTINPKVGLFSAGFITDDLIWMTNLELGYARAKNKIEADRLPIELDIELENYTIDKMIGIHHDTTDWLDLSYMFNHDSSKLRRQIFNTTKSTYNYTYHELVATLNIKGWKPSLTLTLDGSTVKIELGLSFDF